MVFCTIVIEGELDVRFVDALYGMSVNPGGGRTEVIGELVDQAQVQGVLHQLFDLGLSVVSFSTVPADDHPGEHRAG